MVGIIGSNHTMEKKIFRAKLCRYDKSIISDAGIFLSGSQNTNISYSQLVLLEIQKKRLFSFLVAI